VNHLKESNIRYSSNNIKKFISTKKSKDRNANIKLPKISIVMPSYNQGEFIERSILSVLNQNYSNIELIIIDGGSTDNTIEILKKYDEYITYWISEPDNGQSDALNKGFEIATGDIYGWLNSDDLYLPNTFSIVIRELAKLSGEKIIFGDYYTIDKNDNIIDYNYAFDFNCNQFIFEGFHNNAQATFWTKKVHKNFGYFDVKLHRTMDYDMLLRFSLNEGEKSFKRISVPLACFRRHGRQKTRGFDNVTYKEHKYIANKLNTKRFEFPQKYYRIIYRFRRAYWYFKRGGLKYLLNKIF
jgi:glycosyltransferase involved in cell wall biosynthesis